MTRAKQRELDALRAQHEEMVATMHETAARREAVSNQLISHYKGAVADLAQPSEQACPYLCRPPAALRALPTNAAGGQARRSAC